MTTSSNAAIESPANEVCEECGFGVEDGATGCHRVFEEFLARDYSNPLYFRTHRMMVDAYCLQHPERYCRSSKSLATHLLSLCSALEGDDNRALKGDLIREWLDGHSPLEALDSPSSHGELTIEHVRGSESPEDHAEAVEEWARSTWEAYAPLHDLARSWLEQAEAEAN